MSIYNLQLTMKDASFVPTEAQLTDLLAKISALPIPDGALKMILTQKQKGKHVPVLELIIPTQASNG
ncbi:MAG: hypothetical protein IPM69_15375 [Ignavibacteria bacterium]|nr:hypothetical protein [Ignavibacteria bacterium]